MKLNEIIYDKVKAILLIGPTASGKTQLALKLAQYYAVEIISVDSALIYQGMDIGTAKPSLNELNMVKHHLIDIKSPLDTYSVADFINDAVRLIHDLNSKGKLPILVGGTMMYYNGLINGISNLPPADNIIRMDLEQRGIQEGWGALHQELQSIDKVAALKIMPKDKQRIMRALEVFYLTKIPISQLQKENKVHLAKDITFLPLAIMPIQREILHKRIMDRFEQMLNRGFIDEVKILQQQYPALTKNHTSMRAVGYNQVWEYLLNNLTYQQLCEQGVFATRQLAKRQITWLRSMDIVNLAINDDLSMDNLLKRALLLIKEFV